MIILFGCIVHLYTYKKVDSQKLVPRHSYLASGDVTFHKQSELSDLPFIEELLRHIVSLYTIRPPMRLYVMIVRILNISKFALLSECFFLYTQRSLIIRDVSNELEKY